MSVRHIPNQLRVTSFPSQAVSELKSKRSQNVSEVKGLPFFFKNTPLCVGSKTCRQPPEWLGVHPHNPAIPLPLVASRLGVVKIRTTGF